MNWFWRTHCLVDPAESNQAVENSRKSLIETHQRWHRINEVSARADTASAKVRSQREQNHLAEIVRAAMLGGKNR